MKENKRTDEENVDKTNKNQDSKLSNNRDISTIDEQEGNLKHGELGGNLREQSNIQEEEKTKPR